MNQNDKSMNKSWHMIISLIAVAGIIILGLQVLDGWQRFSAKDPSMEYVGAEVRMMIRGGLEIAILIYLMLKPMFYQQAGLFFLVEGIFHEVMSGSGFITLIMTVFLGIPYLLAFLGCLSMTRWQADGCLDVQDASGKRNKAPCKLLIVGIIAVILDQYYILTDHLGTYFEAFTYLADKLGFRFRMVLVIGLIVYTVKTVKQANQKKS